MTPTFLHPLVLPCSPLSSTPSKTSLTVICSSQKRPRPPPSNTPSPTPTTSLSRRACLHLLLALPFLQNPIENAAIAVVDPFDLDLDVPFPLPHFPYHEREFDEETPHATASDYKKAVRVGYPGDTAHKARVYLMEAGVVAFVAAYSAAAMAVSEREALRIQIPIEYDPAILARYFAIRPDKVVWRLAQVVCELVSFGTRVVTDSIADWSDGIWVKVGSEQGVEWMNGRRTEREKTRARLLREGITRLGPAMIKLGQAAGSRPDLFAGSMVRELQKLQDDVMGYFPTIDALRVIWDELGVSPSILFERLNAEPVAGASLGMVFKAMVEGQEVAVKVQRPGVAESIALDCYIVRGLAGMVGSLLRSETDFSAAVDEYSSRLFEELDYGNELRNMKEFRRLYAGFEGVYLPKVFDKYCSRRVLVTEWIDGVKLIDDDARVRKEDLDIVETGIRFALTQLLDKGFLHAVLRTKSGYLAYIDFGLVSEVPTSVRESIVCALIHLIHGEYSRLAECFTGLALMRSNDIEVNLPLLSEALRDAFEPKNQAMRVASSKRGVARFRHFTLVGIVAKLLTLPTRFPFVFNDYFLNNLRCLGMLEGLALNADPNFNVLGLVYPYVVTKILSAPTPRYRQALESLVIDSYGRLRWSRIDELLHDVQESAEASILGNTDPVTPLGLSKAKSKKHAAARRLVTKSLDSPNTLSPDLLISFLTSPSGHFLRQYISAQYISNLERRWRHRIDKVLKQDAATPGSGEQPLQATARELSDDEARVRAREFFKSTPLSKRCRVLLRLAPGFLGPLIRAMMGIISYAMQQTVAAMESWRAQMQRKTREATGSTDAAEVAGHNKTVKNSKREAKKKLIIPGVSRWSIIEDKTEIAAQEWKPFDSKLLQRTQLRRLSNPSS